MMDETPAPRWRQRRRRVRHFPPARRYLGRLRPRPRRRRRDAAPLHGGHRRRARGARRGHAPLPVSVRGARLPAPRPARRARGYRAGRGGNGVRARPGPAPRRWRQVHGRAHDLQRDGPPSARGRARARLPGLSPASGEAARGGPRRAPGARSDADAVPPGHPRHARGSRAHHRRVRTLSPRGPRSTSWKARITPSRSSSAPAAPMPRYWTSWRTRSPIGSEGSRLRIWLPTETSRSRRSEPRTSPPWSAAAACVPFTTARSSSPRATRTSTSSSSSRVRSRSPSVPAAPVTLVVRHQPGGFTGDVDTLSGRAVLVEARAAGEGRVIQFDAKKLRQVVDELPDARARRF